MHFQSPPSIARLCQHSFIGSLLDSNSVVVDLGANRGDFATQIANRWGCIVYAVEPVATLFEQIDENANIRKFNYAISSSNEEVLIKVPANRCASTRCLSGDREIAEISVRGITFDAFLRENEVRVADLLKIDIEGSELELFQTLKLATLRGIGQITVEFHDFIFPDAHRAVEDTKREIAAHGFYCIPFSRNNTDILFVNRRIVRYWEYLYLKLGVRNYRGLLRILSRVFGTSRGNEGAMR